MKIDIEVIREWIRVKRLDDYWTRDDNNGLFDLGKERCLDALEEFLNSQSVEGAKK